MRAIKLPWCACVKQRDGSWRPVGGKWTIGSTGGTHRAVMLSEFTGLVGIDIDKNSGRDGFASLEKAGIRIPESGPRCSTPHDGKHLLFKRPAGLDVRNSEPLPGVEVKAKGAFVMYGPGYGFNGGPLSELPPPLLALVKSPRRDTASGTDTIFAGNRNTALTHFAGRLRRAGLSPDEIGHALQGVNSQRCLPPLDKGELETIVRSAGNWPNGRPSGSSLPSPVQASVLASNPPSLRPELIYKVLRRGHVLLVGGPSKAGKSYALINLALSVVHGLKWLSWTCQQGNVLYVNLEIDEGSFWNRVLKVARSLSVYPDSERLFIQNLRGWAYSVEDVAQAVEQHARTCEADLVILDPLYKLMISRNNKVEENQAEGIGHVFSTLERIASSGAAIALCHHFSKGLQARKDAIDRFSGSGVFGRAPDALISLSATETPQRYQVEAVLREFACPPIFEVLYTHPVHQVVEGLSKLKSAGGRPKKITVPQVLKLLEKFDPLSVDRCAKLLSVAPSTVRRFVKDDDKGAELGIVNNQIVQN